MKKHLFIGVHSLMQNKASKKKIYFFVWDDGGGMYSVQQLNNNYRPVAEPETITQAIFFKRFSAEPSILVVPVKQGEVLSTEEEKKPIIIRGTKEAPKEKTVVKSKSKPDPYTKEIDHIFSGLSLFSDLEMEDEAKGNFSVKDFMEKPLEVAKEPEIPDLPDLPDLPELPDVSEDFTAVKLDDGLDKTEAKEAELPELPEIEEPELPTMEEADLPELPKIEEPVEKPVAKEEPDLPEISDLPDLPDLPVIEEEPKVAQTPKAPTGNIFEDALALPDLPEVDLPTMPQGQTVAVVPVSPKVEEAPAEEQITEEVKTVEDEAAKAQEAIRVKQLEMTMRTNFRKMLDRLRKPKERQAAINSLEEMANQREGITQDFCYMFRDFGVQLRKREIYSVAMLFSKRVIELTPYDDHAHFNLARIFCEIGRYKDAEDALNRAMSIGGDNPTYKKFQEYIAQQKIVNPDKARSMGGKH